MVVINHSKELVIWSVCPSHEGVMKGTTMEFPSKTLKKFAYDANSKAEEDQFISVLTMVLHIPGQDVCPSPVTLLIHGPLRLKSQSSLRFTTMPILFFGHIAAMLLCWCLMTSGSVAWSEAAALWCLGMLGKNPDFFIGPTLLLHAFILHGSSASFTMFHRWCCCCCIFTMVHMVSHHSHHSTDAIYTGICFPDVVGITRQQVFLFWHPLLKLHFQSLPIQQSHHC